MSPGDLAPWPPLSAAKEVGVDSRFLSSEGIGVFFPLIYIVNSLLADFQTTIN